MSFAVYFIKDPQILPYGNISPAFNLSQHKYYRSVTSSLLLVLSIRNIPDREYKGSVPTKKSILAESMAVLTEKSIPALKSRLPGLASGLGHLVNVRLFECCPQLIDARCKGVPQFGPVLVGNVGQELAKAAMMRPCQVGPAAREIS
jgi:hypothetical protein